MKGKEMSSSSQKPERSRKIRKSVSKSKQVKKTAELQQGLGGNLGEIPGLSDLPSGFGELGLSAPVLPGQPGPLGDLQGLLGQHKSVLDQIKKSLTE